MRVLHLNTFDERGGAARVMSGLHRALIECGVDSQALVQFKDGTDPTVHCLNSTRRAAAWRHRRDVWPLMLYRRKRVMHWTRGNVGARLSDAVQELAPDIVHIHWTGLGFGSIRAIGSLPSPAVWTLHDSWAFTGGCHVPTACTRYREKCGACPLLGSRRETDISRRTWMRKERAWRGCEFTLAAPSGWMASCAAASALFAGRRIETIANGVDTSVFHPHDADTARQRLGLETGKRYIVFGAVHADVDENKGLDLLLAACRHAPQALGRAELILYGLDRAWAKPQIPLPVHAWPPIRDDGTLAMLYSAADLVVVPSRLENFPNTILESMACGTPVAAFAAGGVPEIVEQGKTGFLAAPYSTDALAEAMALGLRQAPFLRQRCRERTESAFTFARMADSYRSLYLSIIAPHACERREGAIHGRPHRR